MRALARPLKIHHNTVSKSCRDLVSRGWLQRPTRQSMFVGAQSSQQTADVDLDELINQTIQRASELGYSLQALRSKVVERLYAQPPDHIPVVEQEPELRGLICSEIYSTVGKPVRACSTGDFLKAPESSLGAQVVAPEHAVHLIAPLFPPDRPSIGLNFARADEHPCFDPTISRTFGERRRLSQQNVPENCPGCSLR
jgi:hypothetical protein